ncbi:MAG: hypothetical protein B6D64_06520 [Bacteroidetes bacterium 4484_276]|nr:MAG: hypothetical protein B6D64_06520 [Bacteroidetes bacterium 4484_276]OYT14413.1 MAG: hypothetical protein B6I19_00260 [Bacteroidetes bacterium 4572_114]
MKSKHIFLLIFFFIVAIPGLLLAGSENKYAVSEIPKKLISNSKAVIRNEEIVFTLKSIEDAVTSVKFAITILNRSGHHLSYFITGYDQFRKIRKIEGTIYDKDGNRVRKIKNEDIQDFSANMKGALFVDARMKIIDPKYVKYPLTVEYSYEIVHNGLLNYPDWKPFREYGVAVEKSSFVALIPNDIKLRYYEHNFENLCQLTIEEDLKQYYWLIKNHPSFEEEYFSPPFETISPVVYLAPARFSIDGLEGNCESWEGFGQWINALNEGQDKLPGKTKVIIARIIGDAESDLEKCEILYNYMQDKTRYVNIQIGIGGWKPIDAETVDDLSYGDCKALTNYMKSLLNVAGVDSYYTLVKAGIDAPDINCDFPSNQFNHAILCIPLAGDTVWLECTSQRLPFGHIGKFTDDRHVMLVNRDGGIIVKTKVYSGAENLKTCLAHFRIDNKGNARGEIKTEYKGIYFDKKQRAFYSSEHDMKESAEKALHIPNFVLHDLTYDEKKDQTPSMVEDIVVTSSNFASTMGNRMFIKMNYLNQLNSLPKRVGIRGSDILIRRSTIECDTVVYYLPVEYTIEKKSSNRDISNEFGDFATTITTDGLKLIFTRYLKMNIGVYPDSTYNSLISFLEEVNQADEDCAVLKRLPDPAGE